MKRHVEMISKATKAKDIIRLLEIESELERNNTMLDSTKETLLALVKSVLHMALLPK